MVVLVLPAEGRLAVPMREAIGVAFGRAAFVLPLGFVLGGVLVLARSLAPEATLPYSRIVGLAVLALATLPMQHLILAESGGVVGRAIGGVLVDLMGGPAAVFVLGLTLLVGVLLTFNIRGWSRHAAS